MEDKIIKTAQVIADLYNTEGILWCIEEAKKGEYEYNEETRLASLKALNACLELTDNEVQSAIIT